MDYKKLLILQQTFNGNAYMNVGVTIDTQEQFGVVCQEFPFKYLPESKELPKRDWYDEDGEDVYVPKSGLRLAAYDLEMKFLYVGSESRMSANIKDFIDFICGRINYTSKSNKVTINVTQNVMLCVYDQYTKTGRRGVFVKEVSSELFAYDDVNSEVIGMFKVKFRVTDPVTDIELTA